MAPSFSWKIMPMSTDFIWTDYRLAPVSHCSWILRVIKPMLASTRSNSVRVAYSAVAESGVMCSCFCKNTTLGLEILQGK